MGARRIRREQRQVDMATSRRVNGMVKTKERARRQTRMVALIKKLPFPYTPSIMSWLSGQLDKPTRQIKKEDVDALAELQPHFRERANCHFCGASSGTIGRRCTSYGGANRSVENPS
jgi:hypothetical protein